ncbi:MAG: hypothetical protein ABIH49_03480 [archaeon]
MKSRKNILIAVVFILAVLFVLVLFNLKSNKIIGGEKDENGCLISTGYSWNETIQRCVRNWELEKRYYINEELEFCSRIQFLCAENTEPFYDSTGCGCEPLYTTQK